MIQVKESELDMCIGMMDEACAVWEFEVLKKQALNLLDLEDKSLPLLKDIKVHKGKNIV